MLKYINEDINEDYLKDKLEEVKEAIKILETEYKDFLGWMKIDRIEDDLSRIEACAEDIKSKYDLVIVCGAGGSYLGSRAVIEAVKGMLNNIESKTKVIYMGNNISSNYIQEILRMIENFNPCIIVISKSGSTIETLISFQLVKNYILKKYKNYKERIYIITNKSSGRLREECNREKYKNFVTYDDMGGRYSVLSSVGLLPMAIADVDIRALLKGAKDYKNYLDNKTFLDNDPVRYAIWRNYSYFKKKKNIEILASSNPNLEFILKWYVQLFGESEGKRADAIFPSYLIFSQDLHSMGQYLQEGPGNIFKTILNFEKEKNDVEINLEKIDPVEFKGLKNYSLNKINKKVLRATDKAHRENGVLTATICMDELNEYNLGQLLYFFMYTCAISSILFDSNPFNQPGVEKYKSIFRKSIKKTN